jgi:hypothetical protein
MDYQPVWLICSQFNGWTKFPLQHWSGQFSSVHFSSVHFSSVQFSSVQFRTAVTQLSTARRASENVFGVMVTKFWVNETPIIFQTQKSWSGGKSHCCFTQLAEANFHCQTHSYHRRNGWYRSEGRRKNRTWQLAIGCKHGRRNDKRCYYTQQQLRKSCKCCTRSVSRTIFFVPCGSMAVENYLTAHCKHLSSYRSDNGNINAAILHKKILSASNR